MPEARVEIREESAHRQHEAINQRRDKEKSDWDPNQSIEHAECFSHRRERRLLAVTDGGDHCG